MARARKPPPRVGVKCPHCSGTQQESPLAKSTYCRKCGKHFLVGIESGPSLAPARRVSFLDRLRHLLPQPPPRNVHCFECGTTQRVVPTARSSNCPRCGAYIDLQDVRITGTFSRNVRTHGRLLIGPKGSFNSPRGGCGSAIIFGALTGRIICAGEALIRRKGKITGEIQAEKIVIHRTADVEFSRQLRVAEIEIVGTMTGHIVCEGFVTLRRHAVLRGDVFARGFRSERGAVFSGQVKIGEPDLPSPAPLVEEEAVPPVPPPMNDGGGPDLFNRPASQGA